MLQIFSSNKLGGIQKLQLEMYLLLVLLLDIFGIVRLSYHLFNLIRVVISLKFMLDFRLVYKIYPTAIEFDHLLVCNEGFILMITCRTKFKFL